MNNGNKKAVPDAENIEDSEKKDVDKERVNSFVLRFYYTPKNLFWVEKYAKDMGGV